jgi:hypothetical protein
MPGFPVSEGNSSPFPLLSCFIQTLHKLPPFHLQGGQTRGVFNTLQGMSGEGGQASYPGAIEGRLWGAKYPLKTLYVYHGRLPKDNPILASGMLAAPSLSMELSKLFWFGMMALMIGSGRLGSPPGLSAGGLTDSMEAGVTGERRREAAGRKQSDRERDWKMGRRGVKGGEAACGLHISRS